MPEQSKRFMRRVRRGLNKRWTRWYNTQIASRLRLVPKPARVPRFFIELTNHCNLRCTMCPRPRLQRALGQMDWDLYRRVMDNIGRLGGWYVGLNRFGESLLYPRFVEAVRYAKQQGILRVAVVTNGTLLDEAKAEQILDSGLDQILISLDSLDREAYQSTRKGANFDQVVANVDRFLELRRRRANGKPEVIINSVLIDQSVEQIRSLFEKYQSQVTRISLKPCARYGEGQELAVPGVSRRKWRTCTQPWERLNIFWDGDATVCCGDVEGDLVVGNVKDASLEQLWLQNERAREIRRLQHLQQFDLCLSASIAMPPTPISSKNRSSGSASFTVNSGSVTVFSGCTTPLPS